MLRQRCAQERRQRGNPGGVKVDFIDQLLPAVKFKLQRSGGFGGYPLQLLPDLLTCQPAFLQQAANAEGT
jgi:hypothetical protein